MKQLILTILIVLAVILGIGLWVDLYWASGTMPAHRRACLKIALIGRQIRGNTALQSLVGEQDLFAIAQRVDLDKDLCKDPTNKRRPFRIVFYAHGFAVISQNGSDDVDSVVKCLSAISVGGRPRDCLNGCHMIDSDSEADDFRNVPYDSQVGRPIVGIFSWR